LFTVTVAATSLAAGMRLYEIEPSECTAQDINDCALHFYFEVENRRRLDSHDPAEKTQEELSEASPEELQEQISADPFKSDGRPRHPVIWMGLGLGSAADSRFVTRPLEQRDPAEQVLSQGHSVTQLTESVPGRRLGARRRLGKGDPLGTCDGGCVPASTSPNRSLLPWPNRVGMTRPINGICQGSTART
jgi:hypothetical protein